MEEFLIPNTSGSGGLTFYDRSPPDPAEPINSFRVRVSAHDVSADGRVYAGYAPSHPAGLFAEMAARWSGWAGELTWLSLEGELELHCAHDRLGHVSIRAELRSGLLEHDWRVDVTTWTEAGQLEGIAHRAAAFFGRAA